MLRVVIYQMPGVENDEEAMYELLDGADCELVSRLDPLEGSLIDDELLSCDAVVVLLADGVSDDQSLDKVLKQAVSVGQRIVCVWPKGLSATVVPAGIEKYSSDQIVWDSKRLKSAVTGDDEPSYDAPSGERRAEPNTQRNRC